MSITLCLVVKNEALFLRSCIESALPIADEVVVVDTGSTDATCEIARALGARVYEEAWPGDLGTAHNLPLERARGDWILTLDCDEVLDPAGLEIIPELCQRGDAEGYEFTFHNYLFQPQPNWRRCDATDPLARGALGWIPSRAVRLFKNDPRYRHEGCVHQRINASIEAAGGLIESCDVPIHHYGMLRVDRDKTQFYASLARRQVAASGDARSWLELGIALTHTDAASATRRAFERARDLGLPAEGSFHLGRIESEAGNARAAMEHLQHSLSVMAEEEGIGVHRADILEELGRAVEAAGQPAQAETAFRRALASRPDSPVALIELAGLLIEQGRLLEADDLTECLLEQYRGLEPSWTTLGNLRLARGDQLGACRAFETALDIDLTSVPARRNLTIAYARAGRKGEARRVFLAGLDFKDRSAPRQHDALHGNAAQSARQTRLVVSPRQPPMVVSVCAHLYDGPGRVLADIVEALTDHHRQLVLVADRGDLSGMYLRENIEKLGVEVRPMAWGANLRQQLEELHPSLVVLHWFNTRVSPPDRVASESWVCVGHAPVPMPHGYDAYVVLSEFHQQSQAHVPRSRVHRIPNSVHLARFRCDRRGMEGPVTIAMLSRLYADKFPRRLLHYLPALENLGAQLLIAGRGRRRWEIEPEVEAMGLQRFVRFVGPIPSAEVPAFLSKAEIGLHLTEIAEETMSKAVLEMLAAGLPVVSQPRGSLPELVESGRNGFLAESETEVACHLERLIKSSALRRRMGTHSMNTARRYDTAEFKRRWRTLARSLTEGRKTIGDAQRFSARVATT